MKLHPLCPLLAVLGLAACTHTPPGTSVKVALAKRPVVVRMPVAPQHLHDHGPFGEAFSRGQFCMQAGKDAEAIAAFEEAVKIDPNFSEAWQHLAILYAKVGNEKKSLEAYRRAKKVAQR